MIKAVDLLRVIFYKMRFWQKHHSPKDALLRDISLIAISIIVAILIAQSDAFADFITRTREWEIFGSFIAGIFFVSVFTVAPAGVVLVELMRANSLFSVSFFAACGALFGDLLIFRFVKDSLSKDVKYLLKKVGYSRFFGIFHRRFFRWFTLLVGALIVASPLPDEIGLAMMGFSKMSAAAFIPLSFILNFLGILTIGLISKQF